MAKKEKSPEDLVMDLMTKIKNVFKKDIYIKDKFHIFAGEISDEDQYGDIFCILEPVYKIAIENYFEDSQLIYIDDVVEFKKTPQDHIKYIDDNGINQQLTKKHDDMMNIINRISNWKCFTEESTDIIETLFDKNSSVDFSDGNDSYITLCKKLFPLVTMKNVNNLFYGVDTLDKDMNMITFDFSFTHFKVYMIYYYLKLSN